LVKQCQLDRASATPETVAEFLPVDPQSIRANLLRTQFQLASGFIKQANRSKPPHIPENHGSGVASDKPPLPVCLIHSQHKTDMRRELWRVEQNATGHSRFDDQYKTVIESKKEPFSTAVNGDDPATDQ